MKIYNTLTGRIEEFKPINKKVVNMYVCGPTVNKRTHLGHMYPVIFFDIVHRYFKYLKYKVNYVSNFTDVDDKIIASAIEEKTSEEKIAERYAKLYLEDIKKTNCLEITRRPKVTEYMPQIIKFIDELIKKGYAYKTEQDVYFSVDKISDYGVLSNQKIEELSSGSRVNVDPMKKNPKDFALWKITNDGIKWETSFGTGRPGWHTECVVMVNEIFNGPIDIHGGGIDLKFPHHENEVAQARALFNHSIANYWMHNNHLTLDGIKMSKSLGNVILVDDIVDKYNANVLRIAILKNHYRQPLSLNDITFQESNTINDKISMALRQAKVKIKVNEINVVKFNRDARFEELMNDDFNTPNVITYLLELVKQLNNEIRNNTEFSQTYARILLVCRHLGLTYRTNIGKKTVSIYKEWEACKMRKDFEQADILRKQLIKKGVL